MLSPPATPDTATFPTSFKDPFALTWYSSTISFAPVWTWRYRPPCEADASTVPGPVPVAGLSNVS